MSDKIHPHIDKPDSSTHFICPQGPDDLSTHYLVPRPAATKPAMVQTCKYCNKTDAQIRKENGLS